MNTNPQRIRNDRRSPRRPRRSRPAWAEPPDAFALSLRLLWAPVLAHLLVGLSLLALPAIWQPYFLRMAETFPELSEGLSQSMFAVSLLHLLLAGSLLFVLSAYRQKAAWAWWVFLAAITLGWGGVFALQIEAGVAWAAALSALLVLLGWAALGLGARRVFRPVERAAGEKPRRQAGAADGK
ncbi:MAG: hypothetical protein JXA78_08840 [Anaerolineales bacterium]|nr:hypothetical protein [Anaerolineales bacterium]